MILPVYIIYLKNQSIRAESLFCVFMDSSKLKGESITPYLWRVEYNELRVYFFIPGVVCDKLL